MRALWLCAALAACGPGGARSDAGVDCGVPPALAIEVLTPGGAYQPLGAATDADLVLGFQGFRYIYVRARLTAALAEPGGAVVVTLDGTGARSQPMGDLGFHSDGAGWVSEPARVFFNNDTLVSLVDHGCGLAVAIGTRCPATASGRVVLRYDASCYEDPSGQRVCPDGGP